MVWCEKPLVCACVSFPLEKHERKEAVKYVGKNNGSSIWDNLPSHFFFCNVDRSGKSSKLLYYTIVVYCAEGSYFQNAKDCSSLVSWLSERSMKMMLFLKDASGLSTSIKELDSILLSCHCFLKLSVIIWSTRLSVSVF